MERSGILEAMTLVSPARQRQSGRDEQPFFAGDITGVGSMRGKSVTRGSPVVPPVVLDGLLEVVVLITAEQALVVQNLEVFFGFFGLAELEVELADVLVRTEVSGLDAQGFVVVREGLVHAVELAVTVPKQVVDVGVVGIPLQYPFEIGQRLLIVVGADQPPRLLQVGIGGLGNTAWAGVIVLSERHRDRAKQPQREQHAKGEEREFRLRHCRRCGKGFGNKCRYLFQRRTAPVACPP